MKIKDLIRIGIVDEFVAQRVTVRVGRGQNSDLRAVSGSLWIFAIVLTLIAVITKIVGSGGGALLAGFNRRDSLRLGIGMVSRGEVGLIVASVALSGQVIQRESFSVLVFMIIMATVITPFMLRLAYREADADAIAEADDKSPAQGD